MKNLYKGLQICMLLAFSSQVEAVKLNGNELDLTGGEEITYRPDQPDIIAVKINDDEIQIGSTLVTLNEAAIAEAIPEIVANTRMIAGRSINMEAGNTCSNQGCRTVAGEYIDIKASEIESQLSIMEAKTGIKLSAKKIKFEVCLFKTSGRLHLIAPPKRGRWLKEIEIEFAEGQSEYYDSVVNGEIDLENPETQMLIFTNAKSVTIHFDDPDADDDDEVTATTATDEAVSL